MGCRLSKSIIQAEKECYICRRWYAVKTTRGLEEHHVLNGPLRSFSERHGLKVWLCHQHHNEPGMSPHYNATCAQTLKAVAQAKYEEKNGPGAHAAWMGRRWKGLYQCLMLSQLWAALWRILNSAPPRRG